MHSSISRLQAPEDDQPEEGEDCINYERLMLMQEGFEVAPPKSKPTNKRKAELVGVHDSGSVVRSSGRKDRHSKVTTARGPRDRRLRLSPETAIQFYDVQDRLGYDRPSKAIDWLIKEAKAAIEALDEHPHLSLPNAVVAVGPSTYGEKEKSCAVSNFSFFVDGNAPSSSATELKAHRAFTRNGNEDAILDSTSYNQHQGFCSASYAANLQMLETDWEMGGLLQKRVSWNGDINETEKYSSVTSQQLHFPAEPVLGHGQMFTQREPLQSSVINDSAIGNYFPGFIFSDDFSDIAASVATMEDGEREKQPVFSKPFSPDSFLHGAL